MRINFVYYIKQYKFNSIILRNFMKLFFIFVAILFIPVFMICQNTIKGVYKDAVETNGQQVQKLSSASEVVFRNMEYLAASLLSEQDVSIFISLEKGNSFEKDISTRTSDLINIYMKGQFNVHSIYVYSKNSDSICTVRGNFPSNKFEDITWMDKYSEGFTEGYKLITRKIGRYPNVFTFIKKNDNDTGAVVINIDMTTFGKTIGNVLNNGTQFHIVEGNNIIYSSEKALLFSTVDELPYLSTLLNQTFGILKINGNLYAGSYEVSKYYNWKYIGISPCSEYESPLHYMYFFLLLTIILFIIFIGVASIYFSAGHINQVADIVDLIDNSDKIKYHKDNEITYLANKIICYIDDNKKLKEEIDSRISEYKKLKLLNLQSQISPHFLNNTLTAINNEIVLSYGYNTITTKMIIKLSRLLQYCFVSDDILVTLSTELKFLNKYIDLLKLRYGAFQHVIELEPTLLDYKILRLSLQPIVENAVFHGIKNMRKLGIIKIHGYVREKNVIIDVEDNGDGMNKCEIDAILSSFENNDFEGKNIGIKNVERRLKLIYGKNAGLEIESEQGKYTKVSIIMPIS